MANREDFKSFVATHTPDESLQNLVYGHGIDTCFLTTAGTFLGGIQRFIKRFNRSLETGVGFEICCCYEQYVGLAGVLVKGDVKVASNQDLRSERLEDGTRLFDVNDPELTQHVITNIKEFSVSRRHWSEFILQPKEILGVWLERKALNTPYATTRTLDLIKKKWGLETVLVDTIGFTS